MKKMMIMLGAVAMAACVQAASVDWNVTVAGQGVAWSGAGAYVMAFNGSDYDSVITLLTVTGSEDMSSDLGNYALVGNSLTQFDITNSRGSAKIASASSADVLGDTMFWVVFTEGNNAAGSAVSWTAATDVSDYAYEAGSPSPGTFGVTSFANSGTIAAVPEPTSGVLLLLGMAGLALRRRRA